MLQRDWIEQELPLHKKRPTNAPLPLGGVKVIDFTHFVAGPYASMLLADFGANVIKIEAPNSGDNFRRYPPQDPALELQGAPYLWSNRNKRSVALNLKSPEGIALAKQLIAQADVLMENFSSGVIDRLGLGYEDCKEINPKLIYCSVSAYGREGPFADRLGFDTIVQAESGFVSMNGYPDREGVRATATVMDVGTAMMTSNAVLAALLARQTTDEGQFVEVALYDTAITMTGYAAMQQMFSGKTAPRQGNTSSDSCPTGVFRARDSSFYLHCGTTAIFKRLFEQVVERPDIANTPEFAELNGRLAKRSELFEVLGEIFATQDWDYWGPRMRKAGVPAGQVRSLGEALTSQETRARELVSRLPHPEVGWLPNVAPPIRFSKTPIADATVAPALGQHTREVLSEQLALDPETLEALEEAGVIQSKPAKN